MKCDICNEEMLEKNICTCGNPYININNKLYFRDTNYYDDNERCHDCGILNKKGNVHHWNCDIERCPSCKKQLIGCNCIKKPGKFPKNIKTNKPFTLISN
jgi:hypothetical protein